MSGKPLQEVGAGLSARIYFFDRVVGHINLRGQQLEVEMETHTGHGMYVHMAFTVQSVPGKTGKEVMYQVLMTRYLDFRKDVGANSRTNAFFFPYSPGNHPGRKNERRHDRGRPDRRCAPVEAWARAEADRQALARAEAGAA